MTATPVPVQAAPPDLGEAVLRYLGLDPRNIETRALVLLCERYRLDPLLNHAGVIVTKNGPRPYITRDGMLEIAHRSGAFDGITVDEERRSTDNTGFTAYVSVWRKDMSHPFRYGARCKDDEAQAKQGNGPEMALARAERRALRRAFNIPAYGDEPDTGDVTGDTIDVEPEPERDEARPARLTRAQRDEIAALMLGLGFDVPADQLAYAGGKIGRKLTGPGAMSYDEGEQLVAAPKADTAKLGEGVAAGGGAPEPARADVEVEPDERGSE